METQYKKVLCLLIKQVLLEMFKEYLQQILVLLVYLVEMRKRILFLIHFINII